MAPRYHDWFRQAEADLRHARNSRTSGDFEWGCFAAQQAAEKAVKAVLLHAGMEAWGHTVTALLGNVKQASTIDPDLIDCAKALDKHYIPTRYPNGFDTGAPTDFYTSKETEDAVECAQKILAFARRQIEQ